MPWIQFGFWAFVAFKLILYWGISCQFETKAWHGKERDDTLGTPGFLFSFGGLVTIINIIMSCLLIRIVVRDRSNLSEIFEPFVRYTGCYDAPYAYLDEDDLTSWPGVSRRMMFYFFYSLIAQPFLIFFHAITYG